MNRFMTSLTAASAVVGYFAVCYLIGAIVFGLYISLLVGAAIGGIAGASFLNIVSGTMTGKWAVGTDRNSMLFVGAALGITSVGLGLTLVLPLAIIVPSLATNQWLVIGGSAAGSVLVWLVTTLKFKGSNNGLQWAGAIAMAIVGAMSGAGGVIFTGIFVG
jgi:hypothetical protein